MSTGQLTRVSMDIPQSKGQLASVIMQSVSSQGQMASVSVTTIESVILTAPDVVESQTLVTLDATLQTGTIEWEQIAGTTVALTAVGVDRTFVAPATMDGDVLTFRARSTVGTDHSDWVQVSISVRAHEVWIKAHGTLVPVSLDFKAVP